MSFIARSLLFSLCALLVQTAQAVTIELSFNSLPSAQGWTLVNATGRPENAVYTANGSSLLYDTIGTGSGGWAYYEIPSALDTSQSYSLRLTARVLAEEYSSATGAITFFATANNWYSGIAIGANYLSAPRAGGFQNIPIDATIFHDYRMDVLPSGAYTLLLDGTQVQSGSVNTGALPNLIYFGDGSSGINAKVEITHLSFLQPIPEPTTAALIFGGACLLLAIRRPSLPAKLQATRNLRRLTRPST